MNNIYAILGTTILDGGLRHEYVPVRWDQPPVTSISLVHLPYLTDLLSLLTYVPHPRPVPRNLLRSGPCSYWQNPSLECDGCRIVQNCRLNARGFPLRCRLAKDSRSIDGKWIPLE